MAILFQGIEVYLLKLNTTEMITDELKALVKKEAENLKKYAKLEELEKLDFTKFNGESSIGCPYGQMTGDCFSERATELLNLCSQSYSAHILRYSKPIEKAFEGGEHRCSCSPIEFYTAQQGAKPEALINFLKGKTEILNL